MDGLTLLFKVNLIFIDDQSDKISTDGMRRLFRLLASANKNIARLNQAFKKYDEKIISRDQMRQIFVEVMSNLANTASASMSHGKSAEISLSKTIRDVTGKFKELALTEDDIRALQIIKRAFIAGEEDILTCDELRSFLTRLSALSPLIFDFIYLADYEVKDHHEYAQFLLKRVDTFFNQIPTNHSNLVISHDDIAYLAKYFEIEIEREKIKKTALSAKKHL